MHLIRRMDYPKGHWRPQSLNLENGMFGSLTSNLGRNPEKTYSCTWNLNPDQYLLVRWLIGWGGGAYPDENLGEGWTRIVP